MWKKNNSNCVVFSVEFGVSSWVMDTIKIIPLGAGQDVGKSCVLLSIGGKNIMFDCGMHMGYNDSRRFPDFSYISKTNNFDDVLDCVIISHL